MKLQTQLLCISLSAVLPSAFAQTNSSSQPPVKSAQTPVKTSQPAAKSPLHGLQTDFPMPDNSLWVRYMQAGDAAQAKGDTTLAKKYFFGSLSELEKHPPAKTSKDPFQVVKINTLERMIRETYPKDWSDYENKRDEELKLRKEQVGVLQRIVKINDRLIPPTDLMVKAYKDRYQTAQSEYQKCLEKEKESPEKSEKPE